MKFKIFGYKVFYENGIFTNEDGSSLKYQGKKSPVAFVLNDSNTTVRLSVKKLNLLASTVIEGFVKIPGISNNFTIHKDGRVFSRYLGNFIKTRISRRQKGAGKKQVEIDIVRSDGSKYGTWLHRLLALAFIPNPKNKPEVNHIDGNPMNNDLSNLEWVTKAENVAHAQANYLYGSSQKAVDVFDGENIFIETFQSMQEAADKLGMVSKNANKNISEVCTKNANPDIINKRHPLGLFMSEGHVFKYSSK